MFPNFSSMSIASRLTWAFGFMLLLLGSLAGLSVFELSRANARMNHIVEVNNHRTDLARDLLDHINDMSVRARTIALLTDAPSVAAEAQGLRHSAEACQRTLGLLAAALATEDQSGEPRRSLAALTELGVRAMPRLMAAAKQGEDGENMLASTTLTTEVRPVEAQWKAAVAVFVKLQGEAAQVAVQDARAAQVRAFGVGGVFVLVGLVAGALVGWRVTRGIQRPVADALGVAERIAAGDFTSELPSHGTDELGRLLNAVSVMQDRLRTLVGEIRTAAKSIQLTTGELVAGNLDLSHRTEMMAATLQQSAANMESLATTVRGSAESAQLAHRLASSASEVAERGGAAVSEVEMTMNEINVSSRRISDINGVIDGIAFQTNILALNAAVEAARAGEQGRGFAVVAGEVRTLARRSADAAKEIKALIGDSVVKVESGYRLVAGVGETMTQIRDRVRQLSDAVAVISDATASQRSGVNQVNSAAAQLDQMTQQNSALVEEGAAATESLNEQTQRLVQMVEVFKLERETAA